MLSSVCTIKDLIGYVVYNPDIAEVKFLWQMASTLGAGSQPLVDKSGPLGRSLARSGPLLTGQNSSLMGSGGKTNKGSLTHGLGTIGGNRRDHRQAVTNGQRSPQIPCAKLRMQPFGADGPWGGSDEPEPVGSFAGTWQFTSSKATQHYGLSFFEGRFAPGQVKESFAVTCVLHSNDENRDRNEVKQSGSLLRRMGSQFPTNMFSFCYMPGTAKIFYIYFIFIDFFI